MTNNAEPNESDIIAISLKHCTTRLHVFRLTPQSRRKLLAKVRTDRGISFRDVGKSHLAGLRCAELYVKVPT